MLKEIACVGSFFFSKRLLNLYRLNDFSFFILVKTGSSRRPYFLQRYTRRIYMHLSREFHVNFDVTKVKLYLMTLSLNLEC